jgi:hypothetical protein
VYCFHGHQESAATEAAVSSSDYLVALPVDAYCQTNDDLKPEVCQVSTPEVRPVSAMAFLQEAWMVPCEIEVVLEVVLESMKVVVAAQRQAGIAAYH